MRERQTERSGTEGQALVEMLVVMPVLLLLLLAAADMGKLFVISGKSEIAARYIALSHFREAPFGDAYPAKTAAKEIEDIFFDNALNDSAPGQEDDTDVTYTELAPEEFGYQPGQSWDVFLVQLWNSLMSSALQLEPIRGARSTFAYDLPAFPYGRVNPFGKTEQLPESLTEGRLARTYDANGNFVMLAESFAGTNGESIRLLLESANMIAGFNLTLPIWASYVAVLWLFVFPP